MRTPLVLCLLVAVTAKAENGTSQYYSILLANDDGVSIVDPASKENKTVLPFFGGVKSVGYNLETDYVYAIVKKNVPMTQKIVRCVINKLCVNVCHSSNPFRPENVLAPYKCVNANNLVLDWINKNMYWTCEPTAQLPSTLSRTTLLGWDNITILTQIKPFQSVDIDPFERRLFYLESAPYTLRSTDLDGGKVIDNYYQFDEVALKISVDTNSQIVYVVGHTSTNEDETFLASLNYDLTGFKKLYKSKDPAWRFGPKIVNSVLYWLTTSSNIEWEFVTQQDMEMKRIVVPHYSLLSLNQWSLVHLEAQKPIEGSICSERGCSHSCSHSMWMKITCQCPPGMALREDNTTCYGPMKIDTKKQKADDVPKSEGSNSFNEHIPEDLDDDNFLDKNSRTAEQRIAPLDPYETEESRYLTTQELQRLVLLHQLQVAKVQKQFYEQKKNEQCNTDKQCTFLTVCPGK